MTHKSDKEIIWHTLKYIEDNAPKNGYLDITDSHWKQFSQKRKNHFRKLLVLNGLVRLGDNDQWSFQLTGAAIVAEESDFNNDGKLKNKDKTWRRTIIATLLGAGLGAILTAIPTIGIEVWKSKHLQPIPIDIVGRPKVQIVRDTIVYDTVCVKTKKP